jgi:hypothetical protein
MANYKRAIKRAARREGVDPNILVAQLRAESGLNPNAVSPAGARGIAQFMPGTAPSYGVDLYDGDWRDDVRGAAKFMAENLKTFGGDYKKALAAYNAGPGAVQKYGGVPPYAETQAYVQKILEGAGGAPRPNSGRPPRERSQPADPLAVTVPGSKGGIDKMAALAYFQNRHEPGALLQLAQARKPATPDRTQVYMGEGGNPNRRSRNSETGGPRETNIIRILKLAERMGLHVGEHPKFDPVDPVHSTTSHHYANRSGTGGDAGDVSGPTELMRKFARRVNRRFGPDLEELYWNGPGARNRKDGRKVGKGFVSGHTDHVHVADED